MEQDVEITAAYEDDLLRIERRSDDILWYTKLLQPSQSDTIEFTAPTPAEYPYLCTFPGHWMLMRGVMTVTE